MKQFLYNFLFRKEKSILESVIHNIPTKVVSTPEMRAKCCPLCDGESSKNDVSLHEQFGIHKSGDVSWKPTPGHQQYLLHLRWTKLLSIPK